MISIVSTSRFIGMRSLAASFGYSEMREGIHLVGIERAEFSQDQERGGAREELRACACDNDHECGEITWRRDPNVGRPS